MSQFDKSLEQWNNSWKQLRSDDPELIEAAYQELIGMVDHPVEWSYEVWDDLIVKLTDSNGQVKSTSAQLLSLLAAYSDPDKRILVDFERVFQTTYDPKFVTARQSLKRIWKIARAGIDQERLVVDALKKRYMDAGNEKNVILIRSDIIESYKKIFNMRKDLKVKQMALVLIDLEMDSTVKEKYSKLWE